MLRVRGRDTRGIRSRGCEVKKGGTRCSPAFKFRVVLEALKAEGKGTEAQVARAYGVHPVTLAKWKRHFLQHGAEVFGGKNGNALRVTRDGL